MRNEDERAQALRDMGAEVVVGDARKSLSLASSWATEINLQSRYPVGILTPEIGEASSSACPAPRSTDATMMDSDCRADWSRTKDSMSDISNLWLLIQRVVRPLSISATGKVLKT